MRHFTKQMTKPIPQELVQSYNRPKNMQVWQYLDSALQQPVTHDEWVTFLEGSPWFRNRKRFVRDSVSKFQKYPQFELATYAAYQPKPACIKPDGQCWILNAVFLDVLVQQEPTSGRPHVNHAFGEDFIGCQ